MRAIRIAALCAVIALAACSPPSVPDVTYFRLPEPAALPRAEQRLSALPIEVEVFRGEGIYAEQALIYSNSPDAGAMRTYHYQLWSDPPTRGLQTRLTNMLRASGIAPLVTERLPASDQALRVHGTIVHYERIKRDSGFEVSVEFEMRVEQDSGEPIIEQSYAAHATAADATMEATVRAFGTAVDEAFAHFYADLNALAKETHAR
ncbi:MAG TPA: ABC-type transport auxiliary lipoprotein family protein [Rudaea sp.]|nr:ABC-type transport auxiliary lipoprotein family protein [Rudaea sp.]